MKKKISALLVAISMAATPVSAKVVNKRQLKASSSNQDQGDKVSSKKRLANTFKRFNQIKAEKQFLKETEKDINSALNFVQNQKDNNISSLGPKHNVIHKDYLPNRGIDLTAYIDPGLISS